MKILAIETSGHTMSVALAENNALVAELFWHDGMKHAERLVSSIAGLLREAGWQPAELARIAVSTGPGSFTGVRIGVTCARTMAQTLGVPVVGRHTALGDATTVALCWVALQARGWPAG